MTQAMGGGAADPRAGEIAHLEHGLASALQTLQAIYNENLELRERMELVVSLVDGLLRSGWLTVEAKGKLLEVIRTATPPGGQFSLGGPMPPAGSPPAAALDTQQPLEDDAFSVTVPPTPARSSVSTAATLAEAAVGASCASSAAAGAEEEDEAEARRLDQVSILLEAVIKTVDDGQRSGSPKCASTDVAFMAGTGEQPWAVAMGVDEDASDVLAPYGTSEVELSESEAAEGPDSADMLTRGRAVFSELFEGLMDGWGS